MCTLCAGQGFIVRNKEILHSSIQRLACDGRRLIPYMENVRHVLGGVDACPECQARSEINFYQNQKGLIP